MGIVHYISLLISGVGVLVIAWGVAVSLAEFIGREAARLRRKAPPGRQNISRKRLTGYLLLGLEYLIAADIINTILKPSLQEVAVLGAIVVIRTVLNYFLNLEYRQEIQESEPPAP